MGHKLGKGKLVDSEFITSHADKSPLFPQRLTRVCHGGNRGAPLPLLSHLPRSRSSARLPHRSLLPPIHPTNPYHFPIGQPPSPQTPPCKARSNRNLRRSDHHQVSHLLPTDTQRTSGNANALPRSQPLAQIPSHTPRPEATEPPRQPQGRRSDTPRPPPTRTPEDGSRADPIS
jgi:hypothetical protein